MSGDICVVHSIYYMYIIVKQFWQNRIFDRNQEKKLQIFMAMISNASQSWGPNKMLTSYVPTMTKTNKIKQLEENEKKLP